MFVLAMQGWVPADKQLAGFRDLACPKAADVYVTETNNRPSFGLAAFSSTTYILSQCSLRIWGETGRSYVEEQTDTHG